VNAPGPDLVLEANGRYKAYRPLPAEVRAAALRDGLTAYDRGEFFLAHELMEPAWMGTDDIAERAFISGLIKLAAADVHAERGNPTGVARNLEGARERLRTAARTGATAGVALDLGALLEAIDRRLAEARLARPTAPIPLHWSPR
jgi:predicted metal-dependent hydrolase